MPDILIIDDDDDFAGGLSNALTLEGYAVEVASNGRDGIAASARCGHVACFIDVGLPDIDGVDTLSRVRQIDPRARCFLLTGYSADHLLEQGVDAGAVEVLTKPVDVDELLRKLTADRAD